MKHKFYLLLAIILFLPMVVMADTVKVFCPKTVANNTEFSCDLYCSSNKGVTDIRTVIKLSKNLSFVTFKKADGWKGDGDSLDISLYGEKKFTGNTKFGTLRVKSKSLGSATVMLTNTVLFNDAEINKALENETIKATISVEKQPEVVTDKPKNNNTNNTGNGNAGNTNNTGSSNSGSSNNTNQGTVNNNQQNSNQVVEEKKEETTTEKEETEVEEYEVDLVNGAYLSDLKIKGYNIDFRSDIFNYDLKIKDEKELTITATPSNNKVTYTILNNKNLKDGSVITIETIYDNDDIQHYYINISKEEKKKLNLTIILIAIIVLLVLINLVRMFVSRRKKDEDV